MNESVNIVAIVSKLLDSEKYKEALSIPYDEEHIENFKENCWEIVSVIIKKIDGDTLTIKPSLYAACEQLLSIILERSTPEEALLVFIEQIELAKNDAQFSVSLTPLQQVLKKLSGKRGRSLEWCFNSIRTYIEGISIPDLNLEEKECLLLDSIPNFRRITKIYSMLPLFYDPFIDEIMKSSTDNTKAKEIVSVFLISLLVFRTQHRFILPLSSVNIRNIQGTVKDYNHSEVRTDIKIASVVTENEDHQYEQNVKDVILERALEFVSQTGWSVESLSAGAKSAGYPTITHGLFPNGGGDLIHYFNIKCNQQLAEQMKLWPQEDLKGGSKVPAKFIENAIVTRLLMIKPYKSTWPKAMAIQTLPNNVPNGLATLLSLVDDICYHSGDRSVDFNWYIRRVGLAGIYKAAELFYLTDNSQENNATRSFVSSRIRDAQVIQGALNLNPVTAAPQTLTAAFVTAKNILGINTLK
ncbi:uncharacterized protein LOC101744765 isoform X1 [Bombyx mori]|uniref:Ubiquinone biosynthesis protein n=1 Tax=Bombyx mori TaxID=7091 RepID=A0A8R2C8N0_BOMMO|nr:uncharacterized protein LOC101744765 isoform X2 [Bombyx mori]